jgi:hypothetical protein
VGSAATIHKASTRLSRLTVLRLVAEPLVPPRLDLTQAGDTRWRPPSKAGGAHGVRPTRRACGAIIEVRS